MDAGSASNGTVAPTAYPWTWEALHVVCKTPLVPYMRPTAMEVLMPALVLIIIIGGGLAYQYLAELVIRWKRQHTAQYLNRKGVVLEDFEVDGSRKTGANLMEILLAEEEFKSDFDNEVLLEMRRNVNSVRELFIISLPALGSLVMAGVAILFTQPIMACLWPTIKRPDINTCIACYLAPAGLVYALSFGFMFQQALEKHNSAVDKVTSELSLLDQITTLSTKMKMPSRRHMMAMCKAVKAEVVSMAMLVQQRQAPSFRAPHPPNIKVHLWSILDVLRDVTQHPDPDPRLNTTIAVTTVDYMVQLNNICTDRMGSMQVRIHPLKWVFLEVLGVFTLFGVMMVGAYSLRFENTICNLTLYSMSMLVYVLADLDSPFDGFFRVDMKVLLEVVARAEVVYNCARSGKEIDLAYIEL